jgi:hypothetical protein
LPWTCSWTCHVSLGAWTSRPALRAHGPGVLAELARLVVGAGLCLQCEPGSSTCPGSTISISHYVLERTEGYTKQIAMTQ